jgi:hypothetical protein
LRIFQPSGKPDKSGKSFVRQLRKYSTSGAGHAPLELSAFQPIERLANLRAHLLRYRLQVVAAESEIN